jgi:hypothetical protein
MDAMPDVVLLPEPQMRPDNSSSVPGRTLAVTAVYRLSEQGRKLSLLSGGDGRAVQQLTIHVPPNRLHLVSVDADGVARLRLRPNYEVDAQQHVVRTDAPPTYDAPPDLETLFQQAARNHQLERAFETQHRAQRAARRDADRERRAQLARTFLDNPDRRAVVHPVPTPMRCYLSVKGGLVRFDVRHDDGPARDVPPEAHRRFRADLRARAERGKQLHADQMALHEGKKRYIEDWIAKYGTPDQQARQAGGMLPIEEAIEAITDQVFAPLQHWPRYERGGTAQYHQHLRRFTAYVDAVLTDRDVVVTSDDATSASPLQWARMQDIRNLVPQATVRLRVHRLAHAGDRQAPRLKLSGLLVTQNVGPFAVRREYQIDSAEETSLR